MTRHPHLDFVAVLTVEPKRYYGVHEKEEFRVQPTLILRTSNPPLECVLAGVFESLPEPVVSAMNAVYQSRAAGFGHAGGIMRHSSKSIEIGSRQIMEILAGRMTVEQFNRNFRFTPDSNPFELALRAGKLPVQINVTSSGEMAKDHRMTFELGAPDPAITPFK